MLQSISMSIEGSAPSTQTCSVCGVAIDTSDYEPLAHVACPNCGGKVRVQRAFDHFEVVETLGVGGMGAVYKARDMLMDQFVALKLLRRDLGSEKDHAARFQREARIAASIDHPNVIQVFSSGTDHGQFYVVMELVDHRSLDDLIEERGRLPEGRVLEIGIQVAKGLGAAQQQGLIHRDVKPANILFVDEHTAKISDFGLAGVAGEVSERQTEIWATPYYVAPERLDNRPEDFRSDIYSLGATLFHAVAGKAPIEGDTNSAVALLDLKKRPLDLRAVAPDVSKATASVLQRMIAPDPAQRFSSYNDLVLQLERAKAVLKGMDGLDVGLPRWLRWLARLLHQ
jgi:eukaryotic-like serine/threonine-protein kinase